MAKGFFIAGTDTDVGKTYIAVQLIKKIRAMNYRVLGVKPVGSDPDDLLALKAAAGSDCDDRTINPVGYHGLIAPYLRQYEGPNITVDSLIEKCQETLALPYDFFIVEGCGGFMVPLNDDETMADFTTRLGLPVILVVRMQLGCLNHALLTYQAIKQQKIPIAGWVANTIGDQMLALEENIATLQEWLPVPYLGTSELEHIDACGLVE